jgi:spoIIIJ-associated protein
MKTQDIQNFIEQILKIGDFPFDSIDFDITNEGTKVFKIQTQSEKDFIGKDDEIFKSFNYILKRFCEKNGETNYVTLDINDYQDKKTEKIKIIAHMMAERARFFKSSIELNPMNSFERHIVHEYIQNQADLETESQGFGKNRHVVIKYTK